MYILPDKLSNSTSRGTNHNEDQVNILGIYNLGAFHVNFLRVGIIHINKHV